MYGEILRKLRTEKGLTQQQLAEILGFKSASAVGMLEREERELSMETIIRVTNYFNVSSDYLMGFISSKKAADSDADDKREKEIVVPEDFEDAEQALKFILSQPIVAAYGGYDLKKMSDEEIIEIANDMLFALRLSLQRLRQKRK